MSAESFLIFSNLSFGDLFLSISFFLILSSCIFIRMLMNHRLPWACIHQLTLINKMHDVLFTGFPHSQACFCCPTLDGGQRMEVGPTKQAGVGQGGLGAGAVNTSPRSSIMVCPSKESLIQLQGLGHSFRAGPTLAGGPGTVRKWV